MKILTETIKKRKGIKFKLSAAEIAKQLGVSRQMVWNWKNGRSFPNPDHLKKLEEIGA